MCINHTVIETERYLLKYSFSPSGLLQLWDPKHKRKQKPKIADNLKQDAKVRKNVQDGIAGRKRRRKEAVKRTRWKIKKKDSGEKFMG